MLDRSRAWCGVPALVATALVAAGCAAPRSGPPDEAAAAGGDAAPARSALADLDVQQVVANAGWCWWQSPRAIVARDGAVLAATTPSSAGHDGRSRDNDVSTLDPASGGRVTDSLLSGQLSADDHNSGAVLELPSGRIVTAWAGHSEEAAVRVGWRDPGDPGWTVPPPVARPESDVNLPSTGFGGRARVTYANLVWVDGVGGAPGRLYDLFRGRGDQPVAMVSTDEGETWTYLGQVLSAPGNRPYVHYVGDGRRIWFTATDGHPEQVTGTPFVGGYIEDDVVHRTDGTAVGAVGAGVRPEDLSPIFADDERRPTPFAPEDYGDTSDADAWGSDLDIGPDGAPVALFTVRRPIESPVAPGLFVHDLYRSRLDPATGAWSTHRVGAPGAAGSDLIAGQPSYTGLATTDPADPDRLVLSTDVDPRTGEPQVSDATGRPQHELWEGRTTDDGRTWTWASVTSGSAFDNLRPTIAADDGGWALLWLRGRYDDFEDDYDQELVAVTLRP